MSRIVLASASPRREELIKRLGLDFTVFPSKIDESQFDNLEPEEMVQELARAKAEEVAELVEDTIVIGADTVVVYNGEVLGKPEDERQAISMLKVLQGRKHKVFSGLAVVETDSRRTLIDFDETDVYMRSLEREEIEGYVKTGEPMDKAGSYGIQGIGGTLVERIDGSYYTVMGLPIHKLALMLKEFSIKII